MKTKIIALMITLIVVSATLYHNYTVNALEEAKNRLIEQVNTPTELENLAEELEMNRIERVELQKIIDEKVEQKKAKAQRADEIQDRIREITGL